MNVNAAVISNMARSLWSDLREKRLWPLALALAAGLVAVPLLLSHSAGSTPAVAPLAAGAGPSAGIPAVSVQDTSAHANLYGRGRDPFGQPPGSQGHGVAGTSVPGAVGASGGTGGSSGATGTGATGATAGGSGSVAAAQAVSGPAPAGGAPPPPLPARKPSPGPSGLSGLETYRVSLSITNASGGLNRIDSAERLSDLPSSQQPLVVELGVLQGGGRVLFAVAPGTVLRGPGACIPGPIACEVLSLAPDQIESLSTSSSGAPVAMFAVTGIGTQTYRSATAANDARRAMSVAGVADLRAWSLPAASLFEYQPQVGAVVDLRNLTVGGG